MYAVLAFSQACSPFVITGNDAQLSSRKASKVLLYDVLRLSIAGLDQLADYGIMPRLDISMN